MLEVRFGFKKTIEEDRGFVLNAKREKDGTVTFSLTAEALMYWAKKAERYNKPLTFNIREPNGNNHQDE